MGERKPENVEIGDVVEVLLGEQLALDGCLITNEATLNMAAITGESVPFWCKVERSVCRFDCQHQVTRVRSLEKPINLPLLVL